MLSFCYYLLYNPLHVIILVLLSWCYCFDIFLYTISYMSLFSYYCFGIFFYEISYTSFTRSPTHFLQDLLYIFVLVFLSWYFLLRRFLTCFHFGYLFYNNFLHVFFVVFLWCFLVVSLFGYFLLQQSFTRLCLGIFRYDNLLHVFVSVFSAIKISYTSLS